MTPREITRYEDGEVVHEEYEDTATAIVRYTRWPAAVAVVAACGFGALAFFGGPVGNSPIGRPPGGGVVAGQSGSVGGAASVVPGDSVFDFAALPIAVTSTSATSTAGALSTSTPDAGDSYTDAQTSVTVLRITDDTFPTSNTHVSVDYSNGGPYVSQVWDCSGDDCITVVAYLYDAITWWAIDVNLFTLTLTNARQLPAVEFETSHAWSLDATTPRMWFYTSGGQLNRYDTSGDSLANFGRFSNLPYNPINADLSTGAWLQSGRDDDCFFWQSSAVTTDSAWVVYDIDADIEVLADDMGGASSMNEGYLARDCSHVIIVDNAATTGHFAIRLSDTTNIGAAGDTTAFVHSAIIDSLLVGYDTNNELGTGSRGYANPLGATWGTAFEVDTGSVSGTGLWFAPMEPNAAINHESANWAIGNGDHGKDAYYLSSGDKGSAIGGTGFCAWFLCLYHPADSVTRHLAYSDNRVGGVYNESTFGHLQPNGRGAVFVSVMNDAEGNRSDLFLAIMPRKVN